MEKFNSEECPTWFYRSDNDPMNLNSEVSEWKEFECSDIIENAYLNYLYAISSNLDNLEEYMIYEVTDSIYSIDFEHNFEFITEDQTKSRLVGRFYGDPITTKNTLEEKNIKLFQLKRTANQLILTNTNSIKSSLMLDSNQAFIEYIYLDTVFQITDKTKDNNQAKEDLYMFSIYYINSFESEKEEQLKELKLFTEDAFKGRLKNNSIIWYSKESFVFRMVNNTLRRQNYVEIFWLRYFINCLRKSFEILTKYNSSINLYRGTIIPKNEFERMKFRMGKPFLLNGFISTSGDVRIAKKFMKNDNEELYESALFVIEADTEDKSKFLSIRNFSKFPIEDEYLINMNKFL
jgi:hypothetical protein